MKKSMCKHKQMQATSLALGIETSTACVSIGWGAWERDRGVTVVRPCGGQRHKGRHGEFRLLSRGVAHIVYEYSQAKVNYITEDCLLALNFNVKTGF